MARSAIRALSSYVSTPPGRSNIGFLVRTYSSLALRNIDPVGRRWQAAVLSRTILALDTDVVLRLLVDDLPEHNTILGAVAALGRRGMTVVVPDSVLIETVDSISRGANATYNKFAGVFERFSEEMVEGSIWNVVVRGFYYAMKKGKATRWPTYHSKYWDADRPEEYVVHILRQRLPDITVRPLDDLPLQETPEFEAAVNQLFKVERTRPKASYRTDEEMRIRIYRDLKVLINLASAGKVVSEPIGYFVSGDWRLRKVESMPLWHGKAKVWQPSAALPELAALIAGFEVSDDGLVRLLFNPVLVAAAETMRGELEALVRVGVSMREVPLERLEWNLKGALGDQLRAYYDARASGDEDEIGSNALDLVAAAAVDGYSIVPEVKKAAEEYKATRLERDAFKIEADVAKKEAVAIAGAFIGTSKKGRKRFRKALLTAGIDPKKYLAALQN